MQAEPARSTHHRHLEQSRSQVIDLLSRQDVERDLVQRSQGAGGGERQELVAGLVARQHEAALAQRLAGFHPADVAFVMENLDADARTRAWRLVQAERRGAVLLEASAGVRRSLIQAMAPDDVARAVQPLDSEDIADLAASLPDPVRDAVLDQLGHLDRAQVDSLLSFPPGSVGAEMDTEVITLREDTSIEAVHRLLRRRRELPDHTNELVVVDRGGALRGFLPLSRVLLAEPEARVIDEMSRGSIYFYTDDQMGDAVSAFEKYDLVSAPVVNLHEQVVGRLTVDAVVDALREREGSERLRSVGLGEEDEDLFMPTLRAARRRWPWLAINLCTAFVASRVIGAFEPVIAALVALAALMPIVASMGGNVGNQTVALVIRALAQQRPGARQWRQLARRELGVALLNGALWGGLLGVVTLALYHNTGLALVMAVALTGNLVIAATVGVGAPLLLQRMGRDPALGSSILLTAATDSLGFLIFLGLAACFLLPA